YSRMPPNLLPTVITSLRTRIKEGFRYKNDQNNLLDAAVGCLTLALSTSPSSAQVRKMLYDEVSSGIFYIVLLMLKVIVSVII
ncbi:HEAT repeat-containing protein 6-like, partial [Trifolium medium]|nr:HEAT repeat-containing protein 6-like [Trifolium medium]